MIQTGNILNIVKQPVINIGCLGSVSDGKSTCVYKLTGTKTQRHSSEIERNITVKPGYANMKIWQDDNNKYYSTNSKYNNYKNYKLVHHLSFIDCPGHQKLILTMLGNIDLMHGVIIVVSATEPIKNKPQLIQHLAAAKLANFKKIIVCLNKLDLVSKEVALSRKHELEILLDKIGLKPQIIIPTSFNKNIGLEWLLKSIMEIIPPIDNNCNKIPKFNVSRSFDINKPGCEWNKIIGGVIGGSVCTGKFKIGDMIEIRPGIISKNISGNLFCQPIKTTIKSLQSDKQNLDYVMPGGLIAIGTDIDPYYCKADRLIGSTIGLVGSLPFVYSEIELEYYLTDEFSFKWKPKINDITILQVNTMLIDSKITKIKKRKITFKLTRPVCAEIKSLILISIKQFDILKIIGYGYIIKGEKII